MPTARDSRDEAHDDLSDQRLSAVEQSVAAFGAEIRTLAESVRQISDRIQQPTNWIGIGGLVGGSFVAMIVFVKLITDPINEKIVSLRDDNVADDNRFFDHARDGHPGRVEQLLNANTTADLERGRVRDERLEAMQKTFDEALAEVRRRLQQNEDYAHSMLLTGENKK